MRRENRRIAAMSWGGGESDEPPPKPSRTPMTDSSSKLFQMSSMDGEKPEGESAAGMTYIVAQNPAILAQLMRENEKRGLNPAAYTTPASVFNVLAVEFDQTTENKPVDDIPLKTSKIPAMELNPLKQDKLDIFEKCHPSQLPPNSHFTGAECSESEASYLPMQSPSTTSGLPPQAPDSKCKSLERNTNQNAVSTFSRISSLERRQQQMPDYSMKSNARSQSLIRQYSAGIQAGMQAAEIAAMRSGSLERNQQQQQQLPVGFKTSYSNSLEKFQNPNPQNPAPPPYVRPVKGGSLERSQAIIMNDLMRKYYDQKAATDASKPRSGGSLERNVQYQQYLMAQKQQLQQQLQAQQQHAQAQQQAQAQAQQQQQRQEELIEENIYDFGGVHVKSCATIALKKSIERGMVPPNMMMRSPGYDSNPSSGPSSLENRPSNQPNFKQPQIASGIASRIMIFQQGSSAPVRPIQPQNLSPVIKPFTTFFNQPPPEQMLPIKEPPQVRYDE